MFYVLGQPSCIPADRLRDGEEEEAISLEYRQEDMSAFNKQDSHRYTKYPASCGLTRAKEVKKKRDRIE